MKTIRRNLDEICGSDLGSADRNVLKGGGETYPSCICTFEGFVINWGLCGIGTPLECKTQIENENPGYDSYCYY